MFKVQSTNVKATDNVTGGTHQYILFSLSHAGGSRAAVECIDKLQYIRTSALKMCHATYSYLPLLRIIPTPQGGVALAWRSVGIVTITPVRCNAQNVEMAGQKPRQDAEPASIAPNKHTADGTEGAEQRPEPFEPLEPWLDRLDLPLLHFELF